MKVLLGHWLFWGSLFMVGYIYFGYPFLVLILAGIKDKKVRKTPSTPFVSIIIAAYNEERYIEETITNKLTLDYPGDKCEVIVISDASEDRTDDLVRKYEHLGVRLIRQDPRSGKTSALNRAVLEAKGDIIVFSDANSIYESDALEKLVQNFNDPEVGYVTGKMVYTNPAGALIGDGCTAYMKYENFLRKMETKLGSIVGVDGGVDAVRKSLYRPMKPDQLPDFVLPLKVFEQGYRIVYEPEAVLKEASSKSSTDEFKMRTRVSLRAFWALRDMCGLLIFRPSRLFAWQIWSHKVFRYFCFVFLLGAYFGNIFLWSAGTSYKLFFIAQNLAYLGAMVSPFLERKGHRFLFALNYFVLLNGAAMYAFIKFIAGQKQVIWTPRKGQ